MLKTLEEFPVGFIIFVETGNESWRFKNPRLTHPQHSVEKLCAFPNYKITNGNTLRNRKE
jgi:hypothetical protein